MDQGALKVIAPAAPEEIARKTPAISALVRLDSVFYGSFRGGEGQGGCEGENRAFMLWNIFPCTSDCQTNEGVLEGLLT